MKIIKIINNNAVFTIDDEGGEIIAMGSGIGWNTKIGKQEDKSKIEKVFTIKNETYRQIEKVLKRVDPIYIKIAEKISEKATEIMDTSFDQTLVLALADHISFAINAYKKNLNAPNLILHEIGLLYPMEYSIGEYGVDVINKQLGVNLSDDEKGYIAMHIVNSGTAGKNEDANMIATLTHDISQIVKEVYGRDIDENSFDYMRLLTHIKYLAKRINGAEKSKNIYIDNVLNMLIGDDIYLKETLNKVVECIYNKYNYRLSIADQVYLVMHVLRIVN